MLNQTLNGKPIWFWFNYFTGIWMIVYDYQVEYSKERPITDQEYSFSLR